MAAQTANRNSMSRGPAPPFGLEPMPSFHRRMAMDGIGTGATRNLRFFDTCIAFNLGL